MEFQVIRNVEEITFQVVSNGITVELQPVLVINNSDGWDGIVNGGTL